MTRTKKSAGKIFSLVITVALICLMTVAIVPGVMGVSAVDLGSAGNFAVLTKSGITTTGTTMISGNIGVSPIAATAMTGFDLIADPSNQFSRSSLVTGGIYAADYASPTPATMTTAISNMETAYTDAAGRAPTRATELYAGNLGGRTLGPGVYKWSTGVLIPSGTDLTLDANGDGGAVWVLEVAGDLTMDSASRVVLTNGANADNVYWQIAGPAGAIIGSGSHAEGNILAQKAITMNSGASLNGRALAQTAVTLIANTITSPAHTQAPPSVTTTTSPETSPGTTTTSAGTTTSGGTTTTSAGTIPAQTTTPAPTRTQPITTTITTVVNGDSAIYQADVTGTKLDRLVVTGTVASGPGQGIGQPPGTVYQFIDLEPAQDTPIDQEVISFTVPLSWMDSNYLSPQNVILNRLDGDAWVALPTTFVSTDGVLDYFTATSPVFSRFAITGQFTPAGISTPQVPAVAQTPVAQDTIPVQEQLAPPTSSPPAAKSSVLVWVPVAAMACALMIMGTRPGQRGKNS